MSFTDSQRVCLHPHPLITANIYPLTSIGEAPAEIRAASSGRFLFSVSLRFLTNLSVLILWRMRGEDHGCPPAALLARDSTQQPAWAKWRQTTIHLSPLPRKQGVLRFADLSAFLFLNKQREKGKSQYKQQRQHAGRQCCVYSKELRGDVKGWREAVKFDLPGPVKRTV